MWDYLKLAGLGLVAVLAAIAANYAHDLAYQVNAITVMLAAGIAFLWVVRTAGDPKPDLQHEYFDGVIRAGVIVTDMPFQPPWHGPWVADIWRDPALRGRGVGRWLLARVQQDLIADGCACLGLAVSAGNPARRTYESIGFHTVAQTATVCLPEANRQSADR